VSECFAAYAAHELRGEITLQRTVVGVALADPDADTTALRAMGERVVAACDRQARLIEALLTLARSEYDQLRREPVDLASTTADVLGVHDHRPFRRTTSLEPASVIGNPQLLERLVANLVENAVRHNTPGGNLDVATYTAAGRAGVSIANTGPVIPPKELTRLFQPFQRMRSHPDSVAHGVGLGLAIVQAIATSHDATVDAKAPGTGGLRIDIRFPSLS
jgi:signal transduction histidine kinase